MLCKIIPNNIKMGCGASTNQQPATSQPQKPGAQTAGAQQSPAPAQKGSPAQNITSNKALGNSQSNSKIATDQSKGGKTLNPEESGAGKNKDNKAADKTQAKTGSTTKVPANSSDIKKSGSQNLKNSVSPSKVNLRVAEDEGTNQSEKMGASGMNMSGIHNATTTSGIKTAQNTQNKQQEADRINEDDGDDGVDGDKNKKKKKKKTGSVDPKLNSLIKIYGF